MQKVSKKRNRNRMTGRDNKSKKLELICILKTVNFEEDLQPIGPLKTFNLEFG